MSDEKSDLESLADILARQRDWGTGISRETVASDVRQAVERHCDAVELPAEREQERQPLPDISADAWCSCGWPKASHGKSFGCGARFTADGKEEPGADG